MINFIRRSPSKEEMWIINYEGFVDGLSEGYSMDICEYTNDISCRLFIEENKSNPQIQKMWTRVEESDKKLKSILLPTKRCIFGNYPQTYFWFWGYPPNSPELEDYLKSLGKI